MQNLAEIVYFFNIFILFFFILTLMSYLGLAIISAFTLRRYLKSNSFVNYDILLSSDKAPYLSIIAPAYNEALTIEENVRSLLSLNYNHYEVIVVNDGSKDDSLEVLKRTYKLELVENTVVGNLRTKKIRGIYKSTNPAFRKLTIVDKENGGKADALNVGINVSANPYILCIDVDCILDKDTLLKIVKPLLEKNEKKIIASGGVVRIANSCVVKSGRLLQINTPEKLLPRFQVIEYLRAFLLGRIAWSTLDGLLLISGAFGLFDKELAIKAGGYNTLTVGEDMELLVRMQRYMIENKLAYKIAYIPDPLCWTEAPETYTILRKQRSRWMRGTMETLWLHRKIMFHPKYKILGLLSMPYWLVFEYLAPLLEGLGLILTIVSVVFGLISWNVFVLLLLLIYTFAVMFSLVALLTEEYTYRQYSKIADFRKLLLAAVIEPLVFHPFIVYASLLGNWEKLKGNKGWGDMVRTGFNK
jgi:cellulose synthase/poly-beta-1,6-N-acetylglucosamine synthase-like glycosyltransferase